MSSRTLRVLLFAAVLLLTVEGASQRSATKKAVDFTGSKALDYLKKYGYFEKLSTTKTSIKDAKTAIQQFQKMAGIRVTGKINSETLKMMDKPRCGRPDRNRARDYVASSKWPKKHFTYVISKYPASRLNRQQVDQEIARALQVWSDHTDLTFSVVDRQRDQRPDIDIKFETYNHGDGSSFDGPGGTLAHAFLPTDGRTHFDDAEAWSAFEHYGTNLFQVAAHEFGHSLGLDHSEVPSALMAPFYRGYIPSFRLDNDDIQGIQHLYGSQTNPVTTPMRPQPPNGPDSLCQDMTFDTIFTDLQGVTYIIKGTKYWTLGRINDPQDVQRKWAGLPAKIDAAFSHSEIGKSYIFGGAYVWRYQGDSLDQGYPKLISQRFPGIPDNVDAAFVWPRNNQIYFFKGSEYWKFDYTKRPSVPIAFPRQIRAWWWRQVPDAPDAMFTRGQSSLFAKEGSYARIRDYSPKTDSAGHQSVGVLFGCPNANVRASGKMTTWTARKMDGMSPKKFTSAKSPQLTESMRRPDHRKCMKNRVCKKVP